MEAQINRLLAEYLTHIRDIGEPGEDYESIAGHVTAFAELLKIRLGNRMPPTQPSLN